MKLFLSYTAKLILLTIVLLFGLEFMYSFAYQDSKAIRNKLQLVLKKESIDYDVIALGSSRANNHIVSELFNKKGLDAYNFGMSGASLEESYLLLKLLLDKAKIKTVLLEVDLNISTENYALAHRVAFLPYLNSEATVSNYYKGKIKAYNYYKNLPFYRYMVYDSKIGFREFSLNVINKKSAHFGQQGFSPLYGVSENLNYNLSSSSPKKNKYYQLIKALCKEKNVNLIAFTTPMCHNTLGIEYFNKVKLIYPEIHNLEHVVEEDKYFSTCGHMNIEGAKLFTKYLIKHFF